MNKFNSSSLNDRIASQQIAPRAVPVYAPGRVEARERVRARAAQRKADFVPRWLVFLVLVVLTFVFCVTLNVKSQQKIGVEQQQQHQLQAEIGQLENGNRALAEEIKDLQTSPASIERAARQRLNMMRANERIIVSNR